MPARTRTSPCLKYRILRHMVESFISINSPHYLGFEKLHSLEEILVLGVDAVPTWWYGKKHAGWSYLGKKLIKNVNWLDPPSMTQQRMRESNREDILESGGIYRVLGRRWGLSYRELFRSIAVAVSYESYMVIKALENCLELAVHMEDKNAEQFVRDVNGRVFQPLGLANDKREEMFDVFKRLGITASRHWNSSDACEKDRTSAKLVLIFMLRVTAELHTDVERAINCNEKIMLRKSSCILYRKVPKYLKRSRSFMKNETFGKALVEVRDASLQVQARSKASSELFALAGLYSVQAMPILESLLDVEDVHKKKKKIGRTAVQRGSTVNRGRRAAYRRAASPLQRSSTSPLQRSSTSPLQRSSTSPLQRSSISPEQGVVHVQTLMVISQKLVCSIFDDIKLRRLERLDGPWPGYRYILDRAENLARLTTAIDMFLQKYNLGDAYSYKKLPIQEEEATTKLDND